VWPSRLRLPAPWCASHRVRTESKIDSSRLQPSSSACSLARRCSAGIQARAFSPDGDCPTDRIGAGFRTSERMQCSKPSLCRFAPGAREPRWSDWIYWVGARAVSDAPVMGDERIGTLGDAWAARDRQCDRGGGILPEGLILSLIIVGHCPCSPAGSAEKWPLATALLFTPSRGLKANPAGSRSRVQARSLFGDGRSRRHTAAVTWHGTTTASVKISRCRHHSLMQHHGHQVFL
jgi:hypothetical protein